MVIKKICLKKKSILPGDAAFRAMFENHPASMLLLEPVTGEILAANPAALQFYGYSLQQLCGMTINELNAGAALFDPGKNSFMGTQRLASGEERMVQIHSAPLTLRKKLMHFLIVHALGAQQQMEEMPAIERNLLSTLLDNLPDRIYVKDTLGRKIISNSADWRASGGRTPQDVLGKSDFDTYQPELAAKFWEDDWAVLNSGQPIINREEPGLDSQGQPTWVLTTKMPLRDESGKVSGLVGIGRDITERKKVEDELQESKQLFHLLIESLPQKIYAKDLDGRFIFANQHYCAIQEKSLEEILGKTDFELHPSELAEKYRADDCTVIETGRALEMEEEHVPLDGPKMFVQVIKAPFFNSRGGTAGTLGIFWDISDRKRAELALRDAQNQLENAHLELQQSFAREHHLAHLDELTGINNRRSMMEFAEREFHLAMHYGPALSILMFDIDNFKRINDNFGHPVGDTVLQSLTHNVCGELRASDIIGRYGGDEFVILLPQTSAQAAQALADRIQTRVARIALETDRGLLRITLSIGIAQSIQPGPGVAADTLKALFLRVDRAMYLAKQGGKNCTAIFGAGEG